MICYHLAEYNDSDTHLLEKLLDFVMECDNNDNDNDDDEVHGSPWSSKSIVK